MGGFFEKLTQLIYSACRFGEAANDQVSTAECARRSGSPIRTTRQSFHLLWNAPFAKMNDAPTARCVGSTVHTAQKKSHACTANGVFISTV